MEHVIEIENLSKDYETGFWKKKKVRALDGVSLKVRSGQIFGFLGGNGAGKTTTIKILMTLLFPSGGKAKILGQDISEFRMHHRIGYSPENPYFYDYLTPRELLGYFADIFAIDKATSSNRIEELLDRVGLEEKDRNKQMRKFSKGMMQRVSIAQALVNDPELVFMDEPMSGLDPIGRREIRELIADLREKGKTVFMSTHILSDVEALCDEVAILRNGKLSASGRIEDLVSTTTGGGETFDVHFEGVSDKPIQTKFSNNVSVIRTSPFLILRVSGEQELPALIGTVSAAGGKLVSIQRARLNLEELFTK